MRCKTNRWKTSGILLFFLILLFGIPLVYAQIIEGTGANTAEPDPNFQVLQTQAKASPFFSIGTFRGTSFASTFFLNEPVTFKFGDVISFNVVCNRATMIMERYDTTEKAKFIDSWRSGEWEISGNQAFNGIVTRQNAADRTGQLTVVGYLWCLDDDFLQKNPDAKFGRRISKGQESHKAVYEVIEKTETCTLPDKIISDPYCAEFQGQTSVVQQVRLNCESKPQLVTKCDEGQICHTDSCIGQGSSLEPKAGKPPLLQQEPLPENTVKEKFLGLFDLKNPLHVAFLALVIILLLSFTPQFRRFF